jgi:hypothetical protein
MTTSIPAITAAAPRLRTPGRDRPPSQAEKSRKAAALRSLLNADTANTTPVRQRQARATYTMKNDLPFTLARPPRARRGRLSCRG